ncbi:nucleoside recognition domain-containing protein [Serpentinicella sp. ANB-PHB4]|uniref:nucleoside recognition domain-containing protein n=1 Tax=Serpentinicella sp. ANB-PHB4 TaxID=3074076 RepID=UPI002864CA0E|nr:nucleoside recognition domain-containing protein [Serpentinicella sp. ANB-PHB4]MDR5658358.1 nucleoside recognition domain-containing protein [Serpentinicella sp. ANB-PHB4]
MFLNSIKTGTVKGLETTWMLGKVIIPVYLIVTVLEHTPVIDWISNVFAPFMTFFNLPGEAAIILVLGNVLNLYAAIGAITAISLTAMEVTIIAIMLSFSHSLIVETAVTKKMGISVKKVLFVRLGLAIIFGIVIGQLGGIIW